MMIKRILKALIAALITGLLINGCSGELRRNEGEIRYRFFPPPPAEAKIQFLVSISSSGDIAREQSFLERYVLGEEPQKVINKPYGITLQQGIVYICDTMLPGLEIIDLRKQTFDYFTPAGAGQLKKPINSTLGENGWLYVADSERRQVVIFDDKGRYRSVIGDGRQGKPTDVSIFDNNLLICDLDRHQILVYDVRQLNLKFSFPEANPNLPGYLYSPTNICVAGGRIYVTDTGDSRVKVFDLEGRFVRSFGSYGKKTGQFIRPKGVAADKSGNVFVADAAFENVQVFNDSAELLTYFGGSYREAGDMYLPADVLIDYDNAGFFERFVAPGFRIEYLILVSNQYGPDKVNIYASVKPKKTAGQ